ncbi:hypothetical protein BDR03DRAFT_1001230 [Suillus americanus]|nr:hypothetical protein BDR03DRAFT_1001230 [Suillus americanus]
MSSSFEQLSVLFKEFVQSLKFQISSSTQESQIDIECPPRENREQYYGYRITQDFILAFENGIKEFINPADFYDPMCASLTRNWLVKELRLRQLDYKCCIGPVLEPEDSADEDSEGGREGLADGKEDDTKTDQDERDPTDHEDTKEDDTKADEQASSHYENEKDDPKTNEEGDTTYYEDEKDDDTKTDEEESTQYEDEKEGDPKTDEGDPTHFEDEKEDDPKTDEDQGDASQYEDEKDDDSKTDEHEAIINFYHEDTKEDEDEGYTSHDDEGETSVFGDADNEFEVEYDAEEVVVVISVCSDDPVNFQARPTQAQMDMMTTLLGQPPQWWLSYRDI